ncbi:hypothetical protein [Bradyrhizobium sp. SZCCHNPS2010]|uniref:hypothetical protein n=1 Tax=Bradyrhizobium sp. SZCCHNPS2010 TaxID=3057333 RepID=UPI002916E26A|nr:hypothetical protein [Bradyrhizobium sp. SZCCHNPS2010]
MEAAIQDFIVPGFESAVIRLRESDIDVVTEQVKRPIGAIGLVWQIKYWTNWRPRSTANDLGADRCRSIVRLGAVHVSSGAARSMAADSAGGR